MSKRRVPAALHNELSEYASLLRALRTRDTMDVTKHLTKPSPFALQAGPSNQLPTVNQDDFEGSVKPVSTPGSSGSREDTPSSTRTRSVKGKEKAAVSSGKAKQVQRDHWTRWPLLLDDVSRPEWTLEDEIAVAASEILKTNPEPFPSFRSREADIYAKDSFITLNMELEEDDPDHPHYASFLTYTSANFLSAVFDQLASHIPARAASLQNRTEPLNWRGVIDAVVSCNNPEVCDPEVIAHVVRRMEKLYGSAITTSEGPQATANRAIERSKLQRSNREEIARSFKELDDLIFTQASAPEQSTSAKGQSPKRKTGKGRKIGRTQIRGEREFVARKKWIPKDRRGSKGLSGTSEIPTAEAQNAGPPAPVRRSTRKKGQVLFDDQALPLLLASIEQITPSVMTIF